MPYDMENIEIQFEEETKDECATSSNNISVIKADFAIQSNISDTIDEDEEQQLNYNNNNKRQHKRKQKKEKTRDLWRGRK